MAGQRVEGVVRGAGTDAVDEGLGLWIAVLRGRGRMRAVVGLAILAVMSHVSLFG